MASVQAWFGAAIAEHAAGRPSAPAILRDDGTVSFADVHRAIEGVAATLWRQGARPGRPIVLVLGARTGDLLLLFACHRLGVPVLALAPDDPPPLARALIAAASGDRIISGGSPVPSGFGVPWVAIGKDWLAADPRGLPPPPGPESPCYLVRSSGTTAGVPKLVVTSHAQEVADLDIGWSRFPLGEDDRYLAVVGFQFAFGRGGAQRALMRGGAAILPAPLRAMPDLLAVVARHRPTWTQLTPTHLRGLLAAARPEGQLLPGVKILAGAGPLAVAERRAILRHVTSELYMDYGTNEVGALAMSTPEELRRNPEGVGRPIPGVEMEVVDDDGRPCPSGEVGTLRFRSPLFPPGYEQAVAGSSSRFSDGWFYPGDLGLVDADGQLVLKGRVDDLINVGGLKIYPADIEGCLARHAAVMEAVAVGVPDRMRGTAVTAAVVLRSPASSVELVAHCRDELGAARSPSRIVPFEDLPRNDMGKVDRVALRRLLGEAAEAGRSRSASTP